MQTLFDIYIFTSIQVWLQAKKFFFSIIFFYVWNDSSIETDSIKNSRLSPQLTGSRLRQSNMARGCLGDTIILLYSRPTLRCVVFLHNSHTECAVHRESCTTTATTDDDDDKQEEIVEMRIAYSIES